MLWTLSNKASNAKIRDNWRSESLPQLLLHFVNIPSTSEIWPFKHLMHSADIVKETKLRTERGSHWSCRSLSEIVGVCAGPPLLLELLEGLVSFEDSMRQSIT